MRNLSFFNYINGEEDDFSEILSGLENQEQKKINSKFFYDEKGSRLFDQITKNYLIITQQRKNWKFWTESMNK